MKTILALAAVLCLAAPPRAGAAPPAVRAVGEPGREPQRLAAAEDVKRLCRALEPPERLRGEGDAVEQGEAERAHDLARDRAIVARYQVAVAAAKVPFAPYDAATGTLSVKEPAQVPIAGGTARLWPSEERGLPVEVAAVAARRIVDAQRQGRLGLVLVFDLPDDATCGASPRGDRFSLAVEPVAWRWTDGDVVLARGGAGSDRPLHGVTEGAKPVVRVGDAILGGIDARRVILAHVQELDACYAAALRRDPTLDGVLVADLAGASPEIAADSVGDEGLAGCIRQALRDAAGRRATVPIRFVLQAPEAPRN
jgi:hypothetical protein